MSHTTACWSKFLVMCVTHDVTREIIHKILIHSLVEMLLLRFETLHSTRRLFCGTAVRTVITAVVSLLSLPPKSTKASWALCKATIAECVGRHAATAASSKLLRQTKFLLEELGGISISSALTNISVSFNTLHEFYCSQLWKHAGVKLRIWMKWQCCCIQQWFSK